MAATRASASSPSREAANRTAKTFPSGAPTTRSKASSGAPPTQADGSALKRRASRDRSKRSAAAMIAERAPTRFAVGSGSADVNRSNRSSAGWRGGVRTRPRESRDKTRSRSPARNARSMHCGSEPSVARPAMARSWEDTAPASRTAVPPVRHGWTVTPWWHCVDSYSWSLSSRNVHMIASLCVGRRVRA